MDPETRRLQIHRRDLRNGSIYDCLFSVAMIVSIATTLGLSVSRNCEQLPSRFSFCIPCENRLVIWGIVAAPTYAALRCPLQNVFAVRVGVPGTSAVASAVGNLPLLEGGSHGQRRVDLARRNLVFESFRLQ